MVQRKQPERRTFLQDRFEILIKRQESGKATFNELTELDDIVNRDPEIRERVIRKSILMEDMTDFNEPAGTSEKQVNGIVELNERSNLLSKLKSLLSGIFNRQIMGVKIQSLKPGQALLIL